MIFSKITPFRKIGVGLKWSEIKEMLEALLTFSKNNEEMIQLILVSYYTGMHISEIYEATLKDIDGYLWFDVAVEGGKTKAAKRIIPMHTDLLSQLNQLNLISNNQIRWISPSHNALGKKFLRLRDLVLNHLGQMNNRSQYVHHSFRHGFLTTLHNNGFTGAEVGFFRFCFTYITFFMA
ncbi:MAG: tyrosine-type recombinase/integrase [Alphaproteobacteria bacterium]|nr:tyrosine-type recombinase/integrase [Alphaproteobacteria bacterium]